MVTRTTSPREAGRAGAFAAGGTATARARTANKARDATSHFDIGGVVAAGKTPPSKRGRRGSRLLPQPVHDREETLHPGRQGPKPQTPPREQAVPPTCAAERSKERER